VRGGISRASWAEKGAGAGDVRGTGGVGGMHSGYRSKGGSRSAGRVAVGGGRGSGKEDALSPRSNSVSTHSISTHTSSNASMGSPGKPVRPLPCANTTTGTESAPIDSSSCIIP
jgi:hypothetical protein